MGLKSENIELRDKIMPGIQGRQEALPGVLNEMKKFVVADGDGNVILADVRDLLNTLLERDNLHATAR